ncbi:hypothetical protein KW798_01075 [Candidatus Parcubacteria bacterium]|nr:hypothetical protein [Candidatus Parcubacteria bacterium]
MWQQWVTALLGLLTIAVPFMGLTGDTLTWSLAILGIAVAVLALWGGVEEQQLEQELRERRV